MGEDESGYVFAGLGSEYSLKLLADHLRSKGRNVVELEMSRPNWRTELAEAMRFGRRLLITSQHPYMNGRHYEIHYGHAIDALNVPELMHVLQPDRTCFVPHDLATPIKESEISALSLFDVVLMPTDAWWWLADHVRVEHVGWVKASPVADDGEMWGEIRPRVAWLPSEIGAWSVLGAEAFAAKYRDFAALRPTLKVPVFPGTEFIEEFARNAGCRVVEATVSTNHLIRAADVVVGNGLSSVCLEASLSGVETLCIDDGSVDGNFVRNHWEAFEGLRVVTVDEAVREIRRLAEQPDLGALRRSPLVQDFDFDKALRAIEGEASDTSPRRSEGREGTT